jgi:biotin carboxyl carrier protein
MEIVKEAEKRKDGYFRVTEYYTTHTGVVSIKVAVGQKVEEGDVLYTITRLGLIKKRTANSDGIIESVSSDIEGKFCEYHAHVLDLVYKLSEEEVQNLEEERDYSFVRAPQGAQYYLTPNPGMSPFVTVGEIVETGKVLAVAMVMKKRREIVYEGERAKVARVYFMNGQQCGEGEKLFGLVPRSLKKQG